MHAFYLTTRQSRMLTTLFVLIALALTASPASADAPTVSSFSYTVSDTIPAGDLCAFDVEITAVLNGTNRYFYDRHGQLTRIASHFVEQDTFSANGRQLVGDPFVNVQQALFDENGTIVHAYEVGVIERVPLPNGTAFLSAGRLDFVAHDFSFVFTPDRGRSGNLDAFCAALAP